MEIKRGIDGAVVAMTQELANLSKQTQDQNEIAQVGTISANGDNTIGDIIAEAMDKVGKEGGVIQWKKQKALDTTDGRRYAVRPWLSFTLFRHEP